MMGSQNDGPQADGGPHDVLAAEEFAMPTSDPTLHHAPVVLPDDPAWIEEPHDVLAAEEFAMPAAPPVGSASASPVERSSSRARRIAMALGALLGVLLVRRLLRRR